MSSELKTFLNDLEKKLEENKNVANILLLMEQKSGMKRTHIVLGCSGLLSIWLTFGYGAQLLCNLLCFLYPTYVSVAQLENSVKEKKRAESVKEYVAVEPKSPKLIKNQPLKEEDSWIIYWIVFSIFGFLDSFSEIILNWFPFYWLSKIMIMLWCIIPIGGENGQSQLYRHCILPYFLKYQKIISEFFN